jgi:hypothetical protein
MWRRLGLVLTQVPPKRRFTQVYTAPTFFIVTAVETSNLNKVEKKVNFQNASYKICEGASLYVSPLDGANINTVCKTWFRNEYP